MNISTILVPNNFNHPNLNKYGSTKSACQNSDLNYENITARQSEPFTSYLNFTGRINKLGVKKSNSLDSLIRSLIDFKGDNFEFAQHAFDKMKTHFGYKSLIQDNLQFVDKGAEDDFGARFNWYNGKIQMDRKTCKVLSRCEIASVLRHEFEHFFQFARMFRSEEIGIEGFLKAGRAREVNIVDSEFYILGQEVDPAETPRLLDSYMDMLKDVNMDFWNRIINAKGKLKKDMPEAKQAKKEFEGMFATKPYIKLTSPEDKKAQPLLQAPSFYDFHDIGVKYEYWTNPIEVLARKAEKEFLGKYVKLSKEQYIPHQQKVSGRKQFKAIEKFMNVVSSKFCNNNLPDRFKAYVYDIIVIKFLKENTKYKKKKAICLEEAIKRVKGLTEKEVRVQLLAFKDLLSGGYIRLNSQEETDDFMKFVENYLRD